MKNGGASLLNQIGILIFIRAVYLLFSCVTIYTLRVYLFKSAKLTDPERRFQWSLGLRWLIFVLLIGYLIVVLKTPLSGWFSGKTISRLLLEDLINVAGLLGYLLVSLYQSYQITKYVYKIRSSYGSYLIQHGFLWIVLVNTIVYLRLDYFYMPLIVAIYPFSETVREFGLVIVFIGLQSIALLIRGLRMVPAPAAVVELVNEVARKLGVKIRRVRIWRLEMIGNAFATGFFRRSIFLTESLINSCSTQDLEMIIGHECAHFKLRHLESRVVIIGSLLYLGTTLIEYFPDLYWIYLAIYVLGAFLLFKAIARFQEIQADCLAAKALGGGEKMADALVRVFGYNQSPSKFNRIFVKFLSHPDLELRVRKLKKLG